MNQSILLSIEQLLQFALQKSLIEPMDVIPTRNQLLDLLQLELSGELPVLDDDTNFQTASAIMSDLLDECIRSGLIGDSITERDLMDARIMGLLMPRASETANRFWALYNQQSPQAATSYFYALSKDSNYIQVERLKKNQYWQTKTPYGNLEITINLSKPEKDPRDIARAKSVVQTGYPKCLLCKENAGFAGHLNHPARQNLRLIPVDLEGAQWLMQYSPYLYYNEHSILLSPDHVPMKIDHHSFRRLVSFVKQFPHYFIGSNADLPIVGGSILTHDHFQAGRHDFPMAKADSSQWYTHPSYKGIAISRVKWPVSTIRIACTSQNKSTDALISLADDIFKNWQHYSDESAMISAYTGGTPHNTVTPIARINADGYMEMDLALRNNRTTKSCPFGLFHPREPLHHIKKENIGLIEVMGLAILPGRLAKELALIAQILSGACTMKDALQVSELAIHQDWINQLVEQFGTHCPALEVGTLLQNSVGTLFKEVLEDTGVFKWTQQGEAQFDCFMHHCAMNKID